MDASCPENLNDMPQAPARLPHYGGFVGFDGSCNQAIMIRSLLSRQNTLVYQAGAGVVASSVPDSERQEVDNKLGALKKAIVAATKISQGGTFSQSL